MGRLAPMLVSFLGRRAAARFEAATRDPGAAQHRKLMEIVGRNADTEYGRQHGFRSIRDLGDWRARVPLVTYEKIRDRIERVIEGETNVLTAENPVMFAQTSGSTGKAKYVPVTPTCRGCDHSSRTWVYRASQDHPTMLHGKIVTLVSPAVEGTTPSGIPYGSTSGHMYKEMPRVVRSLYAVPYEVFEIKDYEAKYYALMRLAVASDVSMVCTANPSSIIKMCEMAQKHADALLEDLGRGTLNRDLEIPDEIRAAIDRRLRPDPERARRLETARTARGGRFLPADYWPSLALIGCWKGGTVGAYVQRFGEWFDPEGTRPVPVRDWGYLSSEARGSIPLSDEGCGGVLTVATNVFEFVDVEAVEEDPDDWTSWDFLGVDDVTPGKTYYIFFTTTGGLYRYDINDVVEVVDRYNATPVIAFRRKGRGMTSITGEKVSVNQVIEVFDRAARKIGIAIDHFKAEADVKAARYVFKIEAPQPLPEEVGRTLLRSLDEILSRLNLEYEAKRKSLRLEPPVLEVMKPGWYDFQKRQSVAEGKRAFQAKTILLSMREEPSPGKGPASGEQEYLVSVVTMDG